MLCHKWLCVLISFLENCRGKVELSSLNTWFRLNWVLSSLLSFQLLLFIFRCGHVKYCLLIIKMNRTPDLPLCVFFVYICSQPLLVLFSFLLSYHHIIHLSLLLKATKDLTFLAVMLGPMLCICNVC